MNIVNLTGSAVTVQARDMLPCECGALSDTKGGNCWLCNKILPYYKKVKTTELHIERGEGKAVIRTRRKYVNLDGVAVFAGELKRIEGLPDFDDSVTYLVSREVAEFLRGQLVYAMNVLTYGPIVSSTGQGDTHRIFVENLERVTLTSEFLESIEAGVADLNSGRTLTTEELEKRLGL